MSVAMNILNPSPEVGARLVDTEGRVLPLRGTQLEVEAGAGLARTTLKQRFFNPHAEPLRVSYKLPLPADGDVSGFAFELSGRRIQGQVQTKQKARENFEEALVEGRTAALLEQERSSLFTQEVGNLPPESEVLVEVTVDQPLTWLASAQTIQVGQRGVGGWEFRFPTVVGPKYLGQPGQTKDAEKVSVEVSETKIDVRCQIVLHIADDLVCGHPYSPVHSLRHAGDTWDFEDTQGVALDRDLVVRWSVAQQKASTSILLGRPEEGHARAENSFALLSVVPPATERTSVARDLCFLIDVSGSMSGVPLDQAKKVMGTLVNSLGPDDQLEMIAFSFTPFRWKHNPVKMTSDAKRSAQKWLKELGPGGCTDMKRGIIEALKPLRSDSQRQILLVTDGYIGFEAEIVREIRNSLPVSSRLHTLGVGHGVNRSLTKPAARIGHGKEMLVAPNEDAEKVAVELLAATDKPQVVDLSLSGSVLVAQAQTRLPDLYAGCPAKLSLAVKAEGGVLKLSGKTPFGPYREEIVIPAQQKGQGSRLPAVLFARERVEDFEAEREARGAKVKAIDQEIEKLGVDFQISTRLTSWVAIDEQVSVDPTQATREEAMPHNLVAGVSAEGVGLRQAGGLLPPPPMAAAPAPAGAPLVGGMAPDMSFDDEGEISGAFSTDILLDSIGAKMDSMELHSPSYISEEERLSSRSKSQKAADELKKKILGEAPPAPKKSKPVSKARSLLGRFFGKKEEEVEAPEVFERGLPEGADPFQGSLPEALKTFKGIVRVAKNGRITIEFQLDAEFLLQYGERILLQARDGHEFGVKVIAEKSTKPGNYHAYTQVRLVLAHHEKPARIYLEGAVVEFF